LWAGRFDGEMGDLFALQNEITSRIAIELNLELIAAETARPAESADALDYILRGHAAMYKPRLRETVTEAIGLFERALALDPGSIEAQSLLATMLVGRVLDFGGSSDDTDIRCAEALAAEAVAASPRSVLAHAAKANVLRVQRHCEEAIPEYQTVLAANHNSVEAIANIGRCKIYVGAIEEGIAAPEQAIRLSPRDPYTWIWFSGLVRGICCNHESTTRLCGLKKRETPTRRRALFTLISHRPMHSKERANTLPPNWQRRASWAVKARGRVSSE
jgi:tetratricopeptide (TPR) repeat protein